MHDRTLSRHWLTYQPMLLSPSVKDLTLTQPIQKLIILFDIIQPQDFEMFFPEKNTGRPKLNRISILRAFIAKVVFNITDNKFLHERLQVDYTLRRVCGFTEIRKIPCLATFSNVFREISESGLIPFIHKVLIENYLGGLLLENISRDATAIPAREKAITKKHKKVKKKDEAAPKKVMKHQKYLPESKFSLL